MAAIQQCFAVLETGYSSEYTQMKYGGYGKMVQNLCKDTGEVWDIFRVMEGEFPSQEELHKYDGFVLTGSSYDAHGNEDWILKLCDVLRCLYDKNKKLLGICFGHQVLCRALGGKTGRASVGWELGLKDITLNTDLVWKLYGLKIPSVLKVIESHQDQVSCIPPSGVVLGYSARTAIEIFAVGNSVLGIQGHPEFSEDVMLDLLKSRLARGTISEELYKEGELSFKDGQPDEEALTGLCKAFLKSREVI
ncbi:gamma-glutamyl peptidase 5 isoform X1 [Cryptomeria japonica]|uniref:gamma-glutamyl peptidase 5 isoform X1 n=1 Tax=Cryptomeria japonica TaxID=3369 RepID=UPI0027D9F351|nr:gamma-glutamyl peptidase 5 isoform X1 [Cryptomeria japonica]